MIHFEIPKNQSSIIKVIGVGGGGSNAVNYMHNLGIDGVDFVVCNTDSQALNLSPVVNKVQLGPHLTAGLGAGANPEIGKQSCEESLEDIVKILKVNTRMAFITAGMGGGTGTGGAPVVSKICRELGILTVGIVTTPFSYEGKKRLRQAEEGIARMREHVDTMLVISNDKLRLQFGNLKFTEAFAKADDILATAAKCITDVITTTGQMNVDFADVCTVMKNGGKAILGSGAEAGENRALRAVEAALNSPLLDDSNINGAKWLLLNITSSQGDFEHTMDESDDIQAYVQKMAGENCDIILGMGHDPNLGEKIAVTVIATGFDYKEPQAAVAVQAEPEKIIVTLNDTSAPAKLDEQKTELKQEETNFFDMAPKLVQEPMEYPVPVPVETRQEFRLVNILDEPAQEETPLPTPTYAGYTLHNSEPTVQQEPQMTIEVRNEPVMAATPKEEIVKKGSYILTPDEVEAERRFEQQKRALEERAERLRKMSFNLKGNESHDELENVPAYMRQNIQLDQQDASAATTNYYGGVRVGLDNPEQSNQSSIQTSNTYLNGKRLD